jgi:transcriptional regulator with XRE-family HTH domain
MEAQTEQLNIQDFVSNLKLNSPASNVIKQIKLAMENKNISLCDLYKKTKLAPKLINKILVGKSIASPNTLGKISKALGLSLEELFPKPIEIKVQTPVQIRSRGVMINNWNDENLKLRIVNEIIYEELYNDKKNWTYRAQQRLLLQYSISMTEKGLYASLMNIKNGSRSPVTASAFRKSDDLHPRAEKEKVYAGFYTLEHEHLTNKKISSKYIGLPANQVLSTIKKYGEDAVICEIDNNMFKFMSFLKNYFHPSGNIDLSNMDIFDYLEKTDKKFNVFDFDLMCCINKAGLVDGIVNGIVNKSEATSIMALTTCVGRGIKIEEHNISVLLLCEKLKSSGIEIVSHIREGYHDSNSPMRSELFVLKRVKIKRFEGVKYLKRRLLENETDALEGKLNGNKQVALRFPLPEAHALKLISVCTERPMNDIVLEMINELVKKYKEL